ncbi:MAG: NAD(P)/FAD-dependent oxidoreductase [Vicinamibacterales bacterium]
MKTRYGVSPWVHQFPDSRRPNLPKLRGEHEVDVLIAGGGLTGCAIAYACASAGLKTILVEADRLGAGGASRSAGLLLPEPGPLFRDVAQAHGLRSARRVFEAWRKASLEGAALLRRLNVRAGLEPLSSAIVAGRDAEKVLRREFDARDDAGLGVSWLTPRQAGPATGMDAAAALRQRDAFGLDPFRACLGLAAAAKARGAKLFERSPVTKVRFTRKDAQIITAEAVVRTAKVVVATGTATAEWGQLRRHFKRRESYLVLTEPMPAAMRKDVGPRDLTFRDLRTPRRRVRWTGDHRILVAGGDQDTPPDRHRDATRVQRTGQLMYELLTMYPAISGLRPEYGWELPYGDTADGLMYIGAHRNYPHHVFALGGATDSINGAFLAAKLVTRAVQDASEKEDEVFGFNR